jgi:uncharacterized protein (DUF488 family)
VETTKEDMSALYTIGYEGTDIDRFVDTLQTVGVSVLVDIRAVALSRKKGFSKTALRERLQGVGIAYLHLVELGDPKAGREAARAGRHTEFQRIYSKHLSSARAESALQTLLAIAQDKAVCLLCFERNPSNCHRSIVANRLEAKGLKPFDLYGDSPRRYDNYTTELSRGHLSQSVAAAE